MLRKKSSPTDKRRQLKDYNSLDRKTTRSAVKIDMDIDDDLHKKRSSIFSKRKQAAQDEYSGIKRKKKHRLKLAAFIAVLIVGYFGYKVFAATFSIIDRSGQPGALALQNNIRPDQLK